MVLYAVDGLSLRKSSCGLDCLAFRGSCTVVHASSSEGESVLFISESLVVCHKASMVHVSSILLTPHSIVVDLW